MMLSEFPIAFPTPYTVGVHTYSSDGKDEYDRDIETWTPPLEDPGTPQAVHGWSSPVSTEPKLAGHDRVEVQIELLVPSSFVAGPHDVIDLPNGRFEVIGHPEDYTHGPFSPGFGGLVVNLRRVEG